MSTQSSTYKIIRFYNPSEGKEDEVIKTGLTYKDAQAHCKDPRTREPGVYFDVYNKEQEGIMIIRIYTEDTNRKNTLDLCSTYFAGFTVTFGQGYWKGQVEKSLIIEIAIHSPSSVKRAYRLAKEIKVLNGQESVLVTESESRNQLI